MPYVQSLLMEDFSLYLCGQSKTNVIYGNIVITQTKGTSKNTTTISWSL